MLNSRTLFLKINYYSAGVNPTHLVDIAVKAILGQKYLENSSINEFAVVENIKRKLSKEALTVFRDLYRQFFRTEVSGTIAV